MQQVKQGMLQENQNNHLCNILQSVGTKNLAVSLGQLDFPLNDPSHFLTYGLYT